MKLSWIFTRADNTFILYADDYQSASVHRVLVYWDLILYLNFWYLLSLKRVISLCPAGKRLILMPAVLIRLCTLEIDFHF
jgi:hypothetical protein